MTSVAPPAAPWWRRWFGRSSLLLPLILFMGVFFVLPLTLALAVGFLDYDPRTLVGDTPTFENYERFIFDGFYFRAFVRTFGIAGATTLLTILIGYPVAYHLRQVQSSFVRTVLILIVLLPVTVSFAITAFAWVVILGSNGFINRILVDGTGLLDVPIRLLSENTGVILVLTYTFVPFMIVNVFASLENIDPNLIRSARILGASPRRAFWRVVFPLSMPGVLSGTLLVFALSLGSFIIPTVIGGNQVKTVPVLIYNFAISIFDWPGAAALSGLLLVVSITATWALGRIVRRRLLPWVEGS